MNDWTLLRSYVEEKSEAAFEALVRRHVDMVYSTALRQVRDPHLAQDVTQAVFVLLARKASRLRPSIILGGWLYRTANFVASRALRDRIRQYENEKEAISMLFSAPPTNELWDSLAPHLDVAINELRAKERDAVVLRYLQQRSFREVGEALGVSEDAAKKRVGRALEKLRGKLGRRTVSITGITLATLLISKNAQAAPVAVVAAAIKTGINAGAMAGPTALVFANRVARDWLVIRLKWSFGLLALVSFLTAIVVSRSPAHNPKTKSASPVALGLQPSDDASEQIPRNKKTAFQPKHQGMKLRVVAAESDLPLGDATIRVVFYGTPYINVELAADSDGSVSIVHPNRRFEGMSIWVGSDNRVPKTLFWRREEDPYQFSEYTLKLVIGVTASGLVVDDSQQPVPGAKLNFQGDGLTWNSREYVEYRTSRSEPITNERGEWTANFLADNPKIHGRLNHPDFATTPFVLDLSSNKTNIILKISRGAAISGTVLSNNHESISNAKVHVNWGTANIDDISTNADLTGRFVLPHVPVGKFHIEVSADNYRPTEKWLDFPPEGLDVELSLQPEKIAGNSILRGQVLDESQAPIPGIDVRLSDTRPELQDVSWRATTDADGRFSWSKAPEKFVAVSFFSSDYERLGPVNIRTDGVEQIIQMKTIEAIEIRGTVVDRMTGVAIPAFTIAEGRTYVGSQGDERFHLNSFLTEGKQGTFSFRLGPSDLQDRHEEKAVIQIQAEGYVPELVKLPQRDGNDIQLEVTLEPSSDVSGTVLRPDLRPADKAQVAFLGRNFHVIIQEPGKFLDVLTVSDLQMTRTSPDGVFHLARKRGAERLAIVHESGWAVLPIPTSTNEPIVLAQWAQVTGVLHLGNGVGVNQKVALEMDSHAFEGISLFFSTNTDASGCFHFDKVLAGPMRVSRRFEANPGGAGYAAHSHTKSLETHAGQITELVLGGEGVNVMGHLVAEPVKKGILWNVYPQNLRPAASKPKPGEISPGYGFFCNSDGSFLVEDVPAGDYVLEVFAHARNDHYYSSDFNTFEIGKLKLDFVIPENVTGEFSLGDIKVPVKANF